MTVHDSDDDSTELYDTVNGRRVMTDGGAAAAPAANADPAGGLAGGPGFSQFVAQARLAQAKSQGRDRMAQNAAKDVRKLRSNAQLQKDEWVTLDERLVEIAQENLVVVNDLRGRGLATSEDLSTLIHEWQGTNEFGDAEVDMGAETGNQEDASTFTLHGVPLPIVHKSFQIPYRTLLASRSTGQSLDTQNQAKAARSVMEGLEDLTLNGWSAQVQGYQVYGLTNHPDRNTLSSTTDWDDYTNSSADEVRGDVLDAVELNENDNYGPEGTGYVMYIGRGAYQSLRRWDTGTDQERGLLERLRDEFGDMIEFVRADALADSEAVLVKPVEDVIELAVASDLQNVEWESNDGFTTNMKVMGSITPIVKSDDSGQTGITHLTNLLS